jgi:hypothetical protein
MEQEETVGPSTTHKTLLCASDEMYGRVTYYNYYVGAGNVSMQS